MWCVWYVSFIASYLNTAPDCLTDKHNILLRCGLLTEIRQRKRRHFLSFNNIQNMYRRACVWNTN